MDINMDPYRGYLYIGGYQEVVSGHTYLVKHNLRTGANSNTEQDIGTSVIGLAVDPVTGLVYATTPVKKYGYTIAPATHLSRLIRLVPMELDGVTRNMCGVGGVGWRLAGAYQN